MSFDIKKYDLQFKFDAGTSRGILRKKTSWFIQLDNNGQKGIGECGILKGLSIEDFEQYESNIFKYLDSHGSNLVDMQLKHLPSLRFALEMASLDLLSKQSGILFDNKFTRGERGIPINGLVWMGDYSFMFDQIKKKINEGFRCIKLKIGAIEFEKEVSLLKYIRSQFSHSDIEIRVDANGAFKANEALQKLDRLAEYDIHSIEQPIQKGQWQEMASLCETSPIAIALDEELIGIHTTEEKIKCLDTIIPQFIIFKPSLIGGYRASEEWMALADERGIGYWVTSALESNIGLSAIAQWTYEKNLDLPQGLGTGQLYHNNFEGPLHIKNGSLNFDPSISIYKNFKLFG